MDGWDVVGEVKRGEERSAMDGMAMFLSMDLECEEYEKWCWNLPIPLYYCGDDSQFTMSC